MDLFEALYTTRAMRRVKTDPISEEIKAEILDAAIRAPSGGNAQGWRFLLVDDAEVKAQVGPLYREAMSTLWETIYKPRVDAAAADPESAESREFVKLQRSAQYLADHFEDYPVLLFGFVQADPTGGSIFPAIWNAQLAARGHGIGSSLTSVLIFKDEEVKKVLGVPLDENWVMACCATFGYPTGRWGVAPRRPVHEVTFRNRWGSDYGREIPEPLWPKN